MTDPLCALCGFRVSAHDTGIDCLTAEMTKERSIVTIRESELIAERDHLRQRLEVIEALLGWR